MIYIKTYKLFEEYHGSIGAGIIPCCTNTGRFLLGFRSEEVFEGHTWGGFGGKLDVDEGVDENIEEAAIRELEEESGYNGNIKLIKGCVFRDRNFEYHNYIGLVHKEFDCELNWENDDFRWVSMDELKLIKPKHFGLKYFLNNSADIFMKYCK